MSTRGWVVILVAAVLVAAGCGEGDGERDDEPVGAVGGSTTTVAPITEDGGTATSFPFTDDEMRAGLEGQIRGLQPMPVGYFAPDGVFQPTFGITFTEGWLGILFSESNGCFVRDPDPDAYAQLCLVRDRDDREPGDIAELVAALPQVTVVAPPEATEIDSRSGVTVTFDVDANVLVDNQTVLVAGYRYLYQVLDVDGRTLIVYAEAPREGFDALVADAQALLDLIDFDAEVVP